MSESKLKKEFAKKDVQRLRNLIQGKGGANTTISSGYSKHTKDREEGEVWEEDERTWTIKNGIKQTISKLQEARNLGKTPLIQYFILRDLIITFNFILFLLLDRMSIENDSSILSPN